MGLGTVVVGGLVAWAALRQARTATRQSQIATEVAEIANRQAEIASQRHEAQTKADQRRRITESYSKAVEQIASEKIEVRLGGIYTLEHISRETSGDYWTVMETLCAFVRERARWEEPEVVPITPGITATPAPTPSTDIAAVLAVIARRREIDRIREEQEGWRFDLRGADLRGVNLAQAHLERAILYGAHLERALLRGAHLEAALLNAAHLEAATLYGAHLEGAFLRGAHLQDAALPYAHLEGAALNGAHLQCVNLVEARLEGAMLSEARLEGAVLQGAHLERADLVQAHLEGALLNEARLEAVDLSTAYGDARTRLPDGFPRPAHWPPYEPDPTHPEELPATSTTRGGS